MSRRPDRKEARTKLVALVLKPLITINEVSSIARLHRIRREITRMDRTCFRADYRTLRPIANVDVVELADSERFAGRSKQPSYGRWLRSTLVLKVLDVALRAAERQTTVFTLRMYAQPCNDCDRKRVGVASCMRVDSSNSRQLVLDKLATGLESVCACTYK